MGCAVPARRGPSVVDGRLGSGPLDFSTDGGLPAELPALRMSRTPGGTFQTEGGGGMGDDRVFARGLASRAAPGSRRTTFAESGPLPLLTGAGRSVHPLGPVHRADPVARWFASVDGTDR